MEPVTTREELECSNSQHRAVISMQVLDCNRLDPEVNTDHQILCQLAIKNLIEYLRPTKKRHKE